MGFDRNTFYDCLEFRKIPHYSRLQTIFAVSKMQALLALCLVGVAAAQLSPSSAGTAASASITAIAATGSPATAYIGTASLYTISSEHCHFHAGVEYCGDEQAQASSTVTSSVAGGENCHFHAGVEHCDDGAIPAETATVTSSPNCHFHAGVEHCDDGAAASAVPVEPTNPPLSDNCHFHAGVEHCDASSATPSVTASAVQTPQQFEGSASKGANYAAAVAVLPVLLLLRSLL